MKRSRFTISFIVGGIFLLLDRWLKWQALFGWHRPWLLGRYLGWQPFLNPGIAFGLPLPTALIVAATVAVLIIIGLHFWHILRGKISQSVLSRGDEAGLLLIFLGALSNLYDRLLLRGTIDYFLIGTGVINFADVLIVAGFLVYLLKLKDDADAHERRG